MRSFLPQQTQSAIVGYRMVTLRIYLFAPHAGTLAAIEAAVHDLDRRLTAYRETGTIEYYPPTDSADADRTWPAATLGQTLLAQCVTMPVAA